MRTVSLIGIGRMGGALALALDAKGYSIDALVSNDPANTTGIADLIDKGPRILDSGNLAQIDSDIIFITTQDALITGVAKELAAAINHKPVVFHTSGSLSSEVLGNLRAFGCKTASLHPLVSISDAVLGACRFAGAYFCIEGDPEAVEIARSMVADLGGQPFTIETAFKPLYHASAIMAAGHITALLDASFETLIKCGLDQETTKRVLLPLVASTVENLKAQNPEKALTGTFARADSDTFDLHLAALKTSVSSEILEIYLQLAARSLHLAESNGVDRERIERLRGKVLMAKREVR